MNKYREFQEKLEKGGMEFVTAYWFAVLLERIERLEEQAKENALERHFTNK